MTVNGPLTRRRSLHTDPRSALPGAEGETSAGQGIELGTARPAPARGDVNDRVQAQAQPQTQTQTQTSSQHRVQNPALQSPSAYTAASFPSSPTASPPPPTPTAAAVATQAVPSIGTESVGSTTRLIAPAPVPAPRAGADGPGEAGGYVEDDEGERGRLVRTETEESVEIVGDVLE